ncbi:hypothetical protein [Niabella hibiscisoli]|nr:hypothetical protein [Niabella hibiscisoli]MCH5716062.1 hypothetical protein [Niabella hibiscisoli]
MNQKQINALLFFTLSILLGSCRKDHEYTPPPQSTEADSTSSGFYF